jgi:hypothetical protein
MVLRCAAMRDCTYGELVEVTSFSDGSLPVFSWRKTQESEGMVGCNLQSLGKNGSGKERTKIEVVQTSGGTRIKSHWVVKAQCKSSMLTRRG